MLVIGGMKTVSGAVVGAVLVTVVQEVLRPAESVAIAVGPIHIDRLTGLTQLALVVMIIAVLYFRPEGLMGRRELEDVVGVWLRRLRESGRGRRLAFWSGTGELEDGADVKESAASAPPAERVTRTGQDVD
jgi:hypothetical protein